MDEWRQTLAEARQRLNLSRDDLAAAAGVSPSTVASYERGRRHPSRRYLDAIMFALNLPNAEANRIREAAGFSLVRSLFAGHDPNYFYTTAELPQAVERMPWPEFVLNDVMELIAANSVAQALWGVDFSAEQRQRTRPEMNLLAVASERKFADRMVNWDEVVGLMASVLKARAPQPQSIENPAPYFNEVLEAFAKGDPAFLARLLKVWNANEAREAKVRWDYRVVWRDIEFGEMRFICLVSTASEPDALGFNDWHPADADSWRVLELVKARARRG